jgi:hypothetical protein
VIAEENRLRTIGVRISGQADKLWFAYRETLGTEERHRQECLEDVERPAPMGSLYVEAEKWYAAAGELHDRIEASTPVTVAGAIALFELAEHMVCPEVRGSS